MTTMNNRTRQICAGALATALTLVLTAKSANADAPNLVTSSGITVTAHRNFSPRTVEADISTPLIAPQAVNGPHRIRVTLPNNYYANPSMHYPVIYLLHGGAGGNSAQWTEFGGAAEFISEGKQAIIVMADGGKVGWFTNWVDESGGAQHWADFYLEQLIPWVDANLRTIPVKNGRGIAGLSMGGYGAMRLAQDAPDMFASVASFSGAVDLGDMGTRAVVTEQSIQYLFSPFGAFGNPFWPADAVWNKEDPMKRVDNLKGMQILLYAGAGINDGDVLERTMGQSANRFSLTLDAHGIDHFWWMYGRPGPDAPFACDGGHNFTCWNFAFNDALPRMLSFLNAPTTTPPPAPPPPPPATPPTGGGTSSSSSSSSSSAGGPTIPPITPPTGGATTCGMSHASGSEKDTVFASFGALVGACALLARRGGRGRRRSRSQA